MILNLLKLSLGDFKLIFREKSLRLFFFGPVLILVVLTYVFPPLIAEFPAIGDYKIFIIMGALTQTSVMFGMIYSMVFIEEKETGVSSVFGVLPVNHFLLSTMRMLIPTLMSISITGIVLLLQPLYPLQPIDLWSVSITGGLLTILISLMVAIQSSNKMEGMTWFKAINLIIILPVASFFIPQPFNYLFAIIPTYWPFKFLHDLSMGTPAYIDIMTGIVYSIVVSIVLISMFTKRHYSS